MQLVEIARDMPPNTTENSPITEVMVENAVHRPRSDPFPFAAIFNVKVARFEDSLSPEKGGCFRTSESL
jgi:hypothetical protein